MRGQGVQELTKEDLVKMRKVRSQIWISGMKGFAVGASSGVLGFYAARTFHRNVRKLPMTFNYNTLTLSVCLSACMCSFIFSLTTGKNYVHTLYDIFPKGANPPPQYRKSYEEIHQEKTLETWKNDQK